MILWSSESFLVHVWPTAYFLINIFDLQVSSQQLRDDLMTLLIAGHETTAAVLTWTLHCLIDHPEFMQELQQEVEPLINRSCKTQAS